MCRAKASNLDLLTKESPSNSRNIIGRNPSMVIPLLANQDLTPMLMCSICPGPIYNQRKLSGNHGKIREMSGKMTSLIWQKPCNHLAVGE